jgi:hypothetical protein
MAGFSTPFFAVSAEIAALVRLIASWEGVVVTGEAFRPPLVEPLLDEDVDTVRSRWRRILLTLRAPPVAATADVDILYANPSALVLDLGAETSDEMRAARLSCKEPDAQTTKIWQRANRALKGMTSAGVAVVNPTTGAEGWDRNQRFTAGAEDFFLRGGTLRAFAGVNVYRIGPR